MVFVWFPYGFRFVMPLPINAAWRAAPVHTPVDQYSSARTDWSFEIVARWIVQRARTDDFGVTAGALHLTAMVKKCCF